MPSIYRPTLSIHFFSKNTIGVDTWHNHVDTWLGVDTWRGVDTWPVTGTTKVTAVRASWVIMDLGYYGPPGTLVAVCSKVTLICNGVTFVSPHFNCYDRTLPGIR